MDESKLLFTKSHEWIEPEGEARRCGISAHAQEMLGDIVFVELPEAGRKVSKGEEFIIVESPKAAADVYAPLSGEVVEVNEALEGDPALINKDPYGEGWLVKIKPDGTSGTDDLMDARAYKDSLEE